MLGGIYILIYESEEETCPLVFSLVIIVVDRNEDLMWMDFETRMRKTIKDLVSPIIDRAQEDRTLLFKLKATRKDHMERIKTIENSLFKSKESNTIFDDFETKFLQFEVAMN